MAHSLRELYVEELQDLCSAEQQILEALPRMAAAASAPELRRAFTDHLEETRVQLERLELIFKQLNRTAGEHRCEGMAGLLREGEQRLRDEATADVRDASLIGAAQRVEHYEIAGYGTARTYARLLGDWEGERLLDQTLQEEGRADHLLSHIAESGVNQAAGGDQQDSLLNQQWSRLRFLDASDLDPKALDYSDISVHGRDGDELGTLDGFIVETATGRPFYYVVDSGGWFLGRRYLVPVGKGEFDGSTKRLTVDLDRKTIARYPQFSTSGFMAMNDEEVRRYERRVLQAVNPEAGREPRYWESYDQLPEYRAPGWLASSTWAGADRPVGEIASRQANWRDPGARESSVTGTKSTGHEVLPSVSGPASRSRDEELVTARDEEHWVRDPRDNTRSDTDVSDTERDLLRPLDRDSDKIR